jgi:hypothetical protein
MTDETRTQEILAHTVKLFASILMNTAFIIILISGNLNLFFAGQSNQVTRGLASTSILSGDIADFTATWYMEVGTAIVSVMFINAFALNSKVFQDFFKVKAIRWLDRGFTCDMTRTGQRLQVQLEAMYTGPQMMLEERYGASDCLLTPLHRRARLPCPCLLLLLYYSEGVLDCYLFSCSRLARCSCLSPA